MLTSEFGNYSETDTDSILITSDSFNLNSESSDFHGSEIDTPENINERKIKSKSRSRAQKKVKYWTLPTMSNGTFNPSMLTARQQLQYLAQKSKLGEESDSLELSPFRLDRIKFEEMKSLAGLSSKEQEHQPLNFGNSTPVIQPSSPSNRTFSSSKNVRGSKLKEEISSSPTASKPKETKSKEVRKDANESKQKSSKKIKVSEEKMVVTAMSSDPPVLKGFTITAAFEKDVVPMDDSGLIFNTVNKATAPCVAADIASSLANATAKDINNISDAPIDDVSATLLAALPAALPAALHDSNSFFGNVKNFLFDYKSHHRKHFENFLKDFSKRLGLSPDDEIVKKKREEIIRKGMIFRENK